MRSLFRAAVFALWTTTLITLVVNLLVLFVGESINGAPVVYDQSGAMTTVDAGSVIVAGVIGPLLAAAIALVIVRLFPSRGVTIFVIVGIAVMAAWLAFRTDATTPTGVAMLVIMHSVMGIVVIIGNAVIHARLGTRPR